MKRGLCMLFFKKKRDPSRPHPDWPWTLSEGGRIARTFTWEDIAHDLARLCLDNDSFVILEQKDPADGKKYWFIQSAVALAGPNAGKYIIGCGWGGADGPMLMERCCRELDEVIAAFETAFWRKPLDLSGYEKFDL